MSDQKYVFISYSSKEITVAEQVRDVLIQNGIACWMAPASIEGGSDYTKAIPVAIMNCSAVVLICSVISQDSYWVKSEIIEAINCRKTIIPYIIDDGPMKQEFNFLLSPAHRINAFKNKEASYFALISSINAIMKSEEEIEAHNESEARQTGADDETVGSKTESAVNGTASDADADTLVVNNDKQGPIREPSSQKTGAADAAANEIPTPAAAVKDKPRPANQPSTVRKEGKARVVRSEIKLLPVLITWAVFVCGAAICVAANITADGYESKSAASYLFAVLIFLALTLTAALIAMKIVKKHKNASARFINRTRWLLTGMDIIFTIASFLLYSFSYQFNLSACYFNNTPAFSFIIALLILFAAFISMMIVCTVKFKKGKSFLWFQNTEEPSGAYSSIPCAIMLSFHYLYLIIALSELNYTTCVRSVDFTILCYMPFLTLPMLAVSLLCVRIVIRHKSAPPKTIGVVRMIIAVVNAAFLLYSIVLASLNEQITAFNGYYSSAFNPLSEIIPAIAVMTGIIVLTIVFRRIKYVYE